MKRNITKQLLRDEILTALESALPEEEIQKHVCDAITISNVQKRGLFRVIA